MAFEDMDRRMAERNLRVRLEKWKADVRALPLAEKFRTVADLLDRGPRMHDTALAVARLAVADLEELAKVRSE
jgi:hypothetical protein